MRATDQAIAIPTTVMIQTLTDDTSCANLKPPYPYSVKNAMLATSATVKTETAMKAHGIQLWMVRATQCRVPQPSDGFRE